MATAIWDLGRRGGPGSTLCPHDLRPAALPLRPGGVGGHRRSAAERRRLTVLMTALAIGLLSTLPSALDLFGLSGPYDEEPTAGTEEGEEASAIQAVVQPGDTIWDLAAPHVPEGVSLQDYVAEILLINDVDPGALKPGSVLDLPQRPSDPG